MPRPLLALPLAALLAAGPLTAAMESQPTPSSPSTGQRDLDRGREAVARQDYATAIPALRRAVAALDPQGDRAAFADAWLQLGLAYLLGGGPEATEQALAAFLASAAAAPNPASAYLWAGTAAERLGRADEAELYKARALGAPRPPAPAEPAPIAPRPESAPEAKPTPTIPEALPVPASPPPAEAPVPAESIPETVPAPAAPIAAAPAPAPAPAAPAASEPAEGEAFRHFFGRREPSPSLPPTQTNNASPAAETGRERPAPASGGEPKEAGEGKTAAEPGAAFDHFFRRRRGGGQAPESEAAKPVAGEKADQPDEAAAEEEEPPGF